jgi:glutamine cyclotransferase
VLYEGTGLNGQSSIRKVNLETGEVLKIQPLPQQYFGEGITDWKGQILQLTWQAELGFVYDMNTFEQQRTFTYKGEGWGLTHDATRIIMSDGSADLRFIDPDTLKESGRITVRDQNGPVTQLNELEFVKGEIYANVWQTERIARISPKDGRVVGWIDLHGLLTPAERTGTDVLNGIAYDAARDRLFVTGKWWPRLFEIKLVQRR